MIGDKYRTKIKQNRVIFVNDETGYKIVAVTPEDPEIELNNFGNITITGTNIPELEDDIWYEVEIEEISNSKYKNTFSVLNFGSIFPQDSVGQWKYIRSITTENQYNNICLRYDFSMKILDIILDGSFDYNSISGFGEKTYEILKNKIKRTENISGLLGYFGSDVSINSLHSMLNFYDTPDRVIREFEKNPYSFTRINGFGFKTVDKIALSKGFEKTDKNRILSAIYYVVDDNMSSKGDTYIEKNKLTNECQALLDIDMDLILENTENKNLLDEIDVVYFEDGRYTTRDTYNAEKYIANQILEKNNSDVIKYNIDLKNLISEFENKTGFKLGDGQRKFISSLEDSNIIFLVGNAGSGKSSMQDITIEYAKKANMEILLLAPTGRASKVLSKKTGLNASTIHRAIYKSGTVIDRFEDIVIIDESSMTDIYLLRDLFVSFENSPKTKFIFIGDDSQIPSVNAGNFLHDVINCDVIKINKLNEVFRQKEGGILDIVTKTRQGEKFIGRKFNGIKRFGKNCVIDFRENSKYLDTILKTYEKIVIKGDTPVDDICILTPTNKGQYGTLALNKEIQELVNPETPFKKQIVVGKGNTERIFRVGDYILNTKNNYDIPIVDENGIEILETFELGGDSVTSKDMSKKSNIFNGETGFIVNIVDNELIIEIDGNMYRMDKSNASTSLLHAYATTIHKAQGSEYSIVISIIDKSHTFQLNRNLLYTGLSRAKEYLLIMGQGDTLNNSLNKSENMRRKTFLQELLKEGNNGNNQING